MSVVVVVFEDRAELSAILDNLQPFRGDDLEVVVIDGGSKDGTVDVLRDLESRVDYWLSERDSGVYDAMNKGIAAARGSFILHVNAGDRLLSVPLEFLRACDPEVKVVACRVETVPGGVFVPRNWLLRFQNTWHGQGTFYRREAHLGYDTAYRVFGDFDLNQRLFVSGVRARLRKDVVASHARDGLSSNESPYREKLTAIRTNFGAAPYHLVRGLFFLSYRYWLIRGGLRRRRDHS